MSKLDGDLIMPGNETVQTQEELSTLVFQNQKIVNDLQKRVKNLEAAAYSNSPSKTQKLQRIAALTELNQQITVSCLKAEFKIRSSNYMRELMQEAAKAYDLHFFKGQPGQESFVTKFKVENKAMHAYAEVYRELQGKPIGTTVTESAIAHRYELNGQELMSTIGHLARHNELHIIIPMNTKGCRRVKRVR